MILGIICEPGISTGDAKYYDQDGRCVAEMEAGVLIFADTFVNVCEVSLPYPPVAAPDVPILEEPKPKNEPFYAGLHQKRKDKWRNR